MRITPSLPQSSRVYAFARAHPGQVFPSPPSPPVALKLGSIWNFKAFFFSSCVANVRAWSMLWVISNIHPEIPDRRMPSREGKQKGCREVLGATRAFDQGQILRPNLSPPKGPA